MKEVHLEQPLRLLIADDDEQSRLAVRRALLETRPGGLLLEVEDGPSALAALLAQPFDCALLALHLPGQTGLEVLQRTRAAQVETPLIFITGQEDAPVEEELRRAGAADALARSILSPELLVHSVRQAVRLHEAEQQLRTLAEVLPQMVWSARPDGRVDYYTSRWFEYTGLPPDAHEKWGSIVHPEDLPRVRERWEHSVRTGEPYSVEVRLRRADGSFLWHRGRAQPMRDGRGRVLRWFGTNTDIDDHKRAEERISRLQAVTAALSQALTPRQVMDVITRQGMEAMEAQAGLVALVTGDGQSLDVVSSTGYAPEMLRGLERFPLELPLAVAEAVRSNQLVMHTHRQERDSRYPLLAQHDIPYEAAAAIPLRTGRGVEGALAVSFLRPRTLTPAEQELLFTVAHQGAQALERARLYEAEQRARAAAEEMEAALQERDERLRAALWAGGTGTFRWDIRTGSLEWDENLDRLFGLPAGRTVHRHADFIRLVHPEERAEVARRSEACAREGADFEMDFRVVWPDDGVHWLTCKGKTFVDRSGRPLYMTGACLDITAQKRQEAEALQLAEFERQILGIVSHDLRNPLSTIRLSASMLLARERQDERQSKGLTRILSATDRATRLIRDLLDFSQARLGGGIRVERRELDFHELVQGVIEELAASHPERRVELTLEGEGEGEWDGDRLSQILDNLVGNALQHSPAGTPVGVSCRGEGEALVLEVHNEGPPIEPALLPQLFEPFRRGRLAGNGTGSVGLGLFITRQLVLAHGGGIEVVSTAEAGTRFTVRLPRRP